MIDQIRMQRDSLELQSFFGLKLHLESSRCRDIDIIPELLHRVGVLNTPSRRTNVQVGRLASLDDVLTID